ESRRRHQNLNYGCFRNSRKNTGNPHEHLVYAGFLLSCLFFPKRQTLMNLTLRQLRYFVEVAQCQNFSKAAQRLLIAQPALSQNISRLEKELGAPLLERHARGARLTPEG